MDNKLYKLMNWPRVEGIIYSEEDNPHEIRVFDTYFLEKL